MDKRLDLGVFEVGLDTRGDKSYDPNIFLLNEEEVMKQFFPDDMFVYDRRYDSFRHPEVKKNFLYEFGEINPKTGNWIRSQDPKEGRYIGFWFGNRVPSQFSYEYQDKNLKVKPVKRYHQKVPVSLCSRKCRDAQLIVFKRVKEVEKINAFYK